MNAGRRTKIKYIAIAVLSAVLMTAAVLLGVDIFGKRTEVPFSEKLVLNLRDGNAGEEEYTASVTLQYAETFSCRHGEIETDEELEEHRAELKAYYKARNEKIVKELNLKDCAGVSYSWFGPYIEYRYENADDFLAGDLGLVKEADSPALEKVCVDEYKPENCATRNTSSPNYSFYYALLDVGLQVQFNSGQTIKVGIIDSGKPTSMANLEGATYEIMEGSEVHDDHSFWVSSVLGGNSGIARKSELYFASQEDYSFSECTNWVIGKGVNVINYSYGWKLGYYSATAAYTDYLVRETKVTFVACAGNEGETHVRYPSTGLNVISVASNDADLAISKFSSSGMEEGYADYSLANPTLTAPGGRLTGIQNVSGAISGTSFSTPIVTAITALLMREFPRLKTHPEMVMAALTNTCTPAKGQTEIWDKDAGFGIVNYERARQYCSEQFLRQFNTPAGTAQAGTDCQNIYVKLPFGSTVTAKAFVLYNSLQSVDAYPLQEVHYSDIKIAVCDYTTNELIAEGGTLSNFSFVTFKNETYLTKNPTTEFTLRVYLNSSKTSAEMEDGAVSFYIEEAKAPFGVIYSDGQYFKDGETVSGSFYFKVFSTGFNMQHCYLKKFEGSAQQYTPETVIPANSGDGKYEFYFTYDDGQSPYTSEIFTVYLDSVAPVLVVETQTYGVAPKITTLSVQNRNDFTQYYTAFKVLRIEGDSSAKIDVTKNGKKETYLSGNLPELAGGVYTVRVYDGIGNDYSFNLTIVGAEPQITYVLSPDKLLVHIIVTFEQEFVKPTSFIVYCDGKTVLNYVSENIHCIYRADGEYTAVVKDNIGRTVEKSYTFAKPKPVGVLSVADGASTNGTVSFTYGDDFSAEVLKDGEAFAFDTVGEINFTDDGKYSVKLYYNTDAKSYTEYNFEIDTVPPEFDISGVDENGAGTSPVVITGIEGGVVLEVFRNGSLINYTAGESITAAGEYEVRLTDAAGNVSTCSFVIENTNPDGGDTPVWVIVFVAALVVAVGTVTAVTVVIFRKRRK